MNDLSLPHYTTRTTNIRAMRYVGYGDIPHYLNMGWVAPEPAHFSRLNYYGIEMLWICDCAIPDKPRAAALRLADEEGKSS